MRKYFLIFTCAFLLALNLPAQETEQRTLTLEDAITLALKHNLDIQISGYNPEIIQTNVMFQESGFEALLGSNVDYNSSEQPTGSSLVGESASTTSKNMEWNFNLSQRLKTSTSYRIDFQNSRVDTDRLFTTLNPSFSTSIFASVTQPLLRGFGPDIAQTPLRIALNDRLASDHQLKQRVMDVVVEVELAYWDLVFARKELDVRKQSLAAAQDLYNNNKKQVEVGTMAPLEIVVAQAEVAAREQDIIATEVLIGNLEDRLKTLLLGDQSRELYFQELITSDEPNAERIEFDERESVEKAWANNPDILVLSTDLDSKKLNTKLTRNSMKFQVDFRAQIGFSGLGGDSLIFQDDDPFQNPDPIGINPGGYGDALSTMFDNPTYAVGVVVGIPIGNKAARSDFIRADLTQKQSELVLLNARKQLALNVRTAIRNLQSDLKRLDSARANRVLQEQKLDAERKKLAVGLSTNYTVLLFQDDLARSISQELLAMVDYEKNRARLNRFLGKTTIQ